MQGTATVNLSRPAPFRLRAEDAERLTGGRWHGQPREATVRGAAIDSRRVAPGCLFACLKGERVDGHDFAAAAVGSGAALILATRPVKVPAPVLVVRDVAAALAALAGEFRARAQGCTWIAVAGANGKTTTKELIAAGLRAASRDPLLVTAGNLNNQLGVPLTVFSLPERARYAVVELGSNHPGELAPLAAIVRPDHGCVVSIGPEHLEGFGDLAGVAREECALFAALPAAGTAFLGVHGLEAECQANGADQSAVLAIATAAAGSRRLVRSALPGPDLQLGLLGDHNRANAWLALQVAVAAGADERLVRQGLAAVRATPGRLRPLQVGGHLVIDDCYNANPASMRAGLAVLAASAGRRLAVLGHMGELGAASAEGHAQVGRAAATAGVALIAVGPLAQPIIEAYRAAGGRDGQHAADRQAAAPLAAAWMKSGGPASVLVKGSRSAHLEDALSGICEAFGTRFPGGVH
jgi:UDP-N-acetylmuramoyl-tripeptide--D-alanyl-D-alanine ligase